MKNSKMKNYDSSEKDSIESDEMKHNIHNNKKKIIKKYLNTVEEKMKKEIEFCSYNKLKNNTYNQYEERSFIDSEENIIFTDNEIKNSEDEISSLNKKKINNSFSKSNNNIISNSDNNSNSASLNTELNNIDDNKEDDEDKEEEEIEDEVEEEIEDEVKEEAEEEIEDDVEEEVEKEIEEEQEDDISEETKEGQENKRIKKEIIHKNYDYLEMENFLPSNKSSELISIDIKEKKNDMSQLPTNKDNNTIFHTEIKDINEWKTKYRHLTSSFRKLEKEINKIINNEHINILTRRSIKQHKDFLDNEYKEWSLISQKTISEFKKNIGAQVSELNEKEYLILSKKIGEDFKEKNIEGININFILYLFVIKHEITINDDLMKYLEDCYISTNTDNVLQNTIQKLNEIRNNIKNIGGKTGRWNDDENNYFIKVYESNKKFGDEITVKILRSGINRSEEEIYEHILWYQKFLMYNNLKNKYINNINIININDQKKNSSKNVEKKFLIQKWKEKKRQESEVKIKELEEIKKEEMKIKQKMREGNKKKKQMIQEHMNSKKEEMKKNKIEKRQRSILSEEMLQRINERNEKILQRKVQSNVTFNEENNEKDKKIKQKYTHIQSKLLSNTENILKRIESSVETIKNIM